MSSIPLYFHTLKYLKFSQLYHRVLKKLKHPKPNYIQATRAPLKGKWFTQTLNQKKFLSDTDVCFLNHKGAVKDAADWNNSDQEKLWLYNLHYFDDLSSEHSESQQRLQKAWIEKWILENPPEKGGNGWESYTLSLRVVNWTKAFLSGLESNDEMLSSLAQQADFLSQDLEKHLLGNHYFVNLKALIFAGCYFEGQEANGWLELALKDFEKELKEQVLADGGSFELSPMYHAIMLTDLLDLINLFKAYPSRVPSGTIKLVEDLAVKMFIWLDKMSLGDDKISFFNDSAFGIAPSNETLKSYATSLGINIPKLEMSEKHLDVYDLKQTGYVSVKTSSMNLIADIAEVGPSYIPGHAHADTLSFELSLGKSRVFVNSGTSLYGISEERLRQRGTAAHNTVVVNKTNSSQVWSGFRVAKRANVKNRFVKYSTCKSKVEFSGTQNGYIKQNIKCLHSRSWNVALNSLTITDTLSGKYDNATSYLHLHPDVQIIEYSPERCVLFSANHKIELELVGGQLSVEESTWHPEFGISEKNQTLVIELMSSKLITNIQWTDL